MAISGQTGHDSPAAMRAELERMMAVLTDQVDRMDQWEQRFMTSMADNLMSDEWVPTSGQLFKLRDINTKY